jgi:hypothetical protein
MLLVKNCSFSQWRIWHIGWKSKQGIVTSCVTGASLGIGSSYHGLLGKLLDLLDGLGGALLERGTM